MLRQYHIRNQRAKLHKIGYLRLYNSMIGRPSYFRFVSDFAHFYLVRNPKRIPLQNLLRLLWYPLVSLVVEQYLCQSTSLNLNSSRYNDT